MKRKKMLLKDPSFLMRLAPSKKRLEKAAALMQSSDLQASGEPMPATTTGQTTTTLNTNPPSTSMGSYRGIPTKSRSKPPKMTMLQGEPTIVSSTTNASMMNMSFDAKDTKRQ